MATTIEHTLGVTDVILKKGDEEIEQPSAGELEEAIRLLQEKIDKTREQAEGLLEKQEGGQVTPSDPSDVDRTSVGTVFEEPHASALKEALDDIGSRVGLSEQEYRDNYCLRAVNVDFAAFKARLAAAPVEKRVRIVEAHQRGERGDELVLFRQKDSGEFGLMNPRQIDKALVDREFNAWGADQNGRDPEQSIVSILRSQGMEPAVKNTDALHVTSLNGDKCEGVYWLCLAPRENMTPEELDSVQWAAGFNRRYGGTYVSDNDACYHLPDQGGLGVLWV